MESGRTIATDRTRDRTRARRQATFRRRAQELGRLRLDILLPLNTSRKLKELAAERGQPARHVLLTLIEEAWARHEQPALQTGPGLPAQAAGRGPDDQMRGGGAFTELLHAIRKHGFAVAVGLADLREELCGVSRQQLDSMLCRLHARGFAELQALAPEYITGRDAQAALGIDGVPHHRIVFRRHAFAAGEGLGEAAADQESPR